MTVRERMIKRLIEMGMFDTQARQVVDLCEKEREEMEAMVGRWDDQASDYPKIVMSVLFLSVAGVAREWIKENLPRAWFRPMFEKYI